MSYELQRDESPGESLCRICRKQIELALAIARGDDEGEDTPVHEMRKHLKKARAALRLVRKEIGRGLFRKQDKCLRDAGRLISEIRDAEVRLQTVRQLQSIKNRRGRGAYRGLETMLLLELQSFMAAFAEWQSQAVLMLENAGRAIDGWALEEFGKKHLCRAVQATYKCGRNALEEAKAHPSTESFHELRREAKMLWYQLRILRPVNHVVLKTLTSDLQSLGSLLGQAHDLSFLRERLKAGGGQADWQREGEKLVAVIEVSQLDLQSGAAELADRFYAERPRDFGSRVASWLEDWPNVKSPSVADALVG